MKKVAIIYLCYSQEPYQYLGRAIDGIAAQTYPKEAQEFLVVYNSFGPDETSACPYIYDQLAKQALNLPHFTVLEQAKNLGFVGGNNVGIRWAIANGFDYVLLHNADGWFDRLAVEKLVNTMQSDDKIGGAQSLVMLYPETDLINTAGNSFHFLGFGYCGLYRQQRAKCHFASITEVGYLSGAAMMLRADLLKQNGLFDEDFFIYHDDLEYSLRLRSLGYKTAVATNSVFYHQYRFGRNPNKYYLLERNRYATMLMYFKWPTLILLLPIGLLVEIGILFFSLKSGWLASKLKAYEYWLHIDNWRRWLVKRKTVQTRRVVSDRQLLRLAVSQIAFEDIDNWFLRYIANPLMKAYWWLVKKIIYW